MLRPAFLALLLTGTATFAQADAETVPLLREIKNWVTGCDNLRNCHALSAPRGVDEEDYSSLTLHIWHQAGPEGFLRLRFDHRGEAQDLSTLLLDGQPLGLELTRDLHIELDDQGGDKDDRHDRTEPERGHRGRGGAAVVTAFAQWPARAVAGG